MLLPARLSSKVVVDSSAARALLALAFKEGLLTETPHNDKILERYASDEYPTWLITQALEQVVLFEQLHLATHWSVGAVKGELVEDGPFHSVTDEIDPTARIEAIDPAILNGYLKAKGVQPNPFEDLTVIERMNAAIRGLQQWELRYAQVAPGRISLFIDNALNRAGELPAKYKELESVYLAMDEFCPIQEAVSHYMYLAAAAQSRFAYVMTPNYEGATDRLFKPRLASGDSNPPIVLLRLVSAKLGVLPFGQSLTETLKLARDPATLALRTKIREWTESLTEDSGADTERIQKEISSALTALQKGSVGSTVSNISTYLSIPVGLLGQVTAFATAMGWLITVAGFVGLSASHGEIAKYRWAAFGSSMTRQR